MITQLLSAKSNYLLEIDHIFVCVEKMPEEGFFQQAGFNFVGTPMKQVERGTASQILFFENLYIEFIWIENEVAAEIYAARTGINFLARAQWRHTKLSPFGIALHQTVNSVKPLSEYEFWELQPQASELSLSFSRDNLSKPTEPLCFIIPDAIALPTLLRNFPNFRRQLASHPNRINKMTGMEVIATSGICLTQPLKMLQQNEEVQIGQGNTPCIQFTFDNHIQKGILDARSIDIPIVFNF
jgi:hypothetical protein